MCFKAARSCGNRGPVPRRRPPKLLSRRFSLVLLAVVALTAATGAAVRTGDARAAAAAPTIGVIQTPNFTRARRSAGISQVVIHVLLSDGQVVAHAGTAHRVDWDSSTTPNGAHELELRATA